MKPSRNKGKKSTVKGSRGKSSGGFKGKDGFKKAGYKQKDGFKGSDAFKGKDKVNDAFKGKDGFKKAGFKQKDAFKGGYNGKRGTFEQKDNRDNFGENSKEDWKEKKIESRKPKWDDGRKSIKDDSDFEIVNEDDPKELVSDSDDDSSLNMESEIQAVNRKGKKSGGFQSMGLSYPVFKSITNQGYKVPTPIQRKSIPIILQGKDIVAMARTGSGKTAAFLIPIVEKLKAHSAKVGARCLVLSPSRELASQTLKFTKEFCKNTDLRAAVFVGGDNMEDQFNAIANNPDIIIATPGRLMHLIIEMNLELRTIAHVVFDEADRLFEMGFAEQIREITAKLPENRQTLLFSATLPKILVDFARAGLQNPTLIRLDVDTKISKQLKMYFFAVKSADKQGALLFLLRNSISEDQQTVIFVSTKYHVEFIHELLVANGFTSTYIYGSLDPAARKVNLARFRYGKVKIMVVTDVAARGIDIPLLDNVINFDFPPTSKIFVHRVGRTARAGKSGSAWSIVTNEEVPFMLDLQLFTGRPLVFASTFKGSEPSYVTELVYGNLPAALVELENESLAVSLKQNHTLGQLFESSKNGFMKYLSSRPSATKASYQRAKEISTLDIGVHPLFASHIKEREADQFLMINAISSYRPQETIFEAGKRGSKSSEAVLMQKRRFQLQKTILGIHQKHKQIQETEYNKQKASIAQKMVVEQSEIEALEKLANGSKDSEYFLSYLPQDHDTEVGYSVHGDPTSSFSQNAQKVTVDMVADDPDDMKTRGELKWDSQKKRFTRNQIGADNKKRIKTESGATVLASFKSDRYEKWQKKTKISIPRAGDAEVASVPVTERRYRHNNVYTPNINSKSFTRKLNSKEKELRKSGLKGKDFETAKKEYINQFQQSSNGKQELQNASQIAKALKLKDKRREKTGRHKTGKRKSR